MNLAQKIRCTWSMSSPLFALLLCLVTPPALGASAGFTLTALDRYVQAPDDNYRYEVIEVVSGEYQGKAYQTYIVEMVSQQWLTSAEVNLPLWVHELVITVPEDVTSDIGFSTLPAAATRGIAEVPRPKATLSAHCRPAPSYRLSTACRANHLYSPTTTGAGAAKTASSPTPGISICAPAMRSGPAPAYD